MRPLQVLVEPQCRGLEHADVNAAIVAFVQSALGERAILFTGERMHVNSVLQALADRLPAAAVEKDLREARRWDLAGRAFFELRLLWRAYRRTPKGSAVLSLSCTQFSVAMHLLFATLFRRRAVIIFHGLIESVAHPPKSFALRVAGLRRQLLLSRSRRLYYLFTASFIERNVLSYLPSLTGRTGSLTFPYLFGDVRGMRRAAGACRVVSCVGVGAVNKGTGLFFDLAARLGADPRVDAEFVFAGRLVDDALKALIPPGVTTLGVDDMLEPAEYESVMARTDFLVMTYPRDSYRFGLSGVVLDAIRYEVPIVGLRNACLDYCESVIGQIGWLCDDAKALAQRLESLLVAPDQEAVERIRANFARFKASGAAERSAAVLRGSLCESRGDDGAVR